MIKQSLEGLTEQSSTMTSSKRCRKKKFDGASQWSLEDWISILAKGGGAKNRFQYFLNPNSSNQFLYLRAIQGHSGDTAIDTELQDHVLLPKGYSEYIYHVGNPSELNSIIRHGLIPGGRSLKRGRQAVYFTTVNPMEDVFGMGETPRDLTKPRIVPYKNTWKRLQNTVVLVQFEPRSRERLAFFSKHGHMLSFSTAHYLPLPVRKQHV